MKSYNLPDQVRSLESLIFPCFGKPLGEELPQVAEEEEIIVDVLQNLSLRSHESVIIGLNHQVDPSYYKGD